MFFLIEAHRYRPFFIRVSPQGIQMSLLFVSCIIMAHSIDKLVQHHIDEAQAELTSDIFGTISRFGRDGLLDDVMAAADKKTKYIEEMEKKHACK